MYRCQLCKEVVPAGTRQRLVVETRPASYPYRPHVYGVRGLPRVKWQDDPGGAGREIARATPACPRCALTPR